MHKSNLQLSSQKCQPWAGQKNIFIHFGHFSHFWSRPSSPSMALVGLNKWRGVTTLLRMGGQGHPTPIHTPCPPNIHKRMKRLSKGGSWNIGWLIICVGWSFVLVWDLTMAKNSQETRFFLRHDGRTDKRTNRWTDRRMDSPFYGDAFLTDTSKHETF